MRENTDQKNSKYEHFLRSDTFWIYFFRHIVGLGRRCIPLELREQGIVQICIPLYRLVCRKVYSRFALPLNVLWLLQKFLGNLQGTVNLRKHFILDFFYCILNKASDNLIHGAIYLATFIFSYINSGSLIGQKYVESFSCSTNTNQGPKKYQIR